jgi:hypothetical protein
MPSGSLHVGASAPRATVGRSMGHEWVLWILLTASALHVVEERGLGWQGWAAETIGPRIGVIPTWLDFWATNGLLIVFGVSASAVGWRAPAFALAFPALCLINAVFFHFLPTLQARRPNPGFFTALLLYLPIGLWSYAAASADGVLDGPTLLLSAALGAVAMSSAIVLLIIQPRFRYPDVPSPELTVSRAEGSGGSG